MSANNSTVPFLSPNMSGKIEFSTLLSCQYSIVLCSTWLAQVSKDRTEFSITHKRLIINANSVFPRVLGECCWLHAASQNLLLFSSQIVLLVFYLIMPQPFKVDCAAECLLIWCHLYKKSPAAEVMAQEQKQIFKKGFEENQISLQTALKK